MLSKLAVKRLTKLADYMDSLPKSAEKHFNMGAFVRHHGDHEHDYPKFMARNDLNLCGTAACAAGWAATMPYFRKLGLKLSPPDSLDDGFLFIAGDSAGIDSPSFHSMFGGISFGEANALFGSELERDIKTPKQWAKHCRKFIKENSK